MENPIDEVKAWVQKQIEKAVITAKIDLCQEIMEIAADRKAALQDELSKL